jgi:hypothetical protein
MNLDDSGQGSLRDAIAATPSGGTVDFQPGLSGTITLMTGELLIDKDLTIAGPGAGVVTVSGNNNSRVFDVTATATAAISGLTIADGSADFGGGIANAGTLTISDSVISGNTSVGGGGIGNVISSRLTIINSTISGNSAAGSGSVGGTGGGINNATFASLTVIDSFIVGNTATTLGAANTASGGGIYTNGPLTILRSSISNNLATGGFFAQGGGIYDGFDVLTMISSSTISGNTASGNVGGGGIYNEALGGTMIITDCAISGNVGANASGIYNMAHTGGGRMSIVGSTISGNSGFSASAILNDGTLMMANSVIRNNFIGITNNAFLTTMSIANSAIIGNASTGIEDDGGTSTVANSTISDNGAGITHQALTGVTTIAGCTVTGNRVVGISSFQGSVVVTNTITAGNGSDVVGTINSQGHNLIGDGTGGSGFAGTDLVGTADLPIDPMLRPLGDYGGPTQTMPPLPGSPVINAGDNTDAPATDQRGFARIVLGFIDIGAVELQPDEFGGPGG